MLNQKRPNPIDAKKIKREEDHRNQSNNGCVPYLVGRRPRHTPHFRANVAQVLRGPREESRRMLTSCGFAFTPNCWRGFGQSAANLVFFFAHRYSGFSQFPSMAGVPGFEPGLSVLETDVLTVDTIPLCRFPIADFQPLSNVNFGSAIRNRQCPHLVSLWLVCLRQRRQNLLNSRRSVVVFLFFVVT